MEGTDWAAQRRLCLPRKANRRKCFSWCEGHQVFELAAVWCRALKAGKVCEQESARGGVEEFRHGRCTVRWRGVK